MFWHVPSPWDENLKLDGSDSISLIWWTWLFFLAFHTEMVWLDRNCFSNYLFSYMRLVIYPSNFLPIWRRINYRRFSAIGSITLHRIETSKYVNTAISVTMLIYTILLEWVENGEVLFLWLFQLWILISVSASATISPIFASATEPKFCKWDA